MCLTLRSKCERCAGRRSLEAFASFLFSSFVQYVKIAPELKELFLRRQQVDAGASSSVSPRARSPPHRTVSTSGPGAGGVGGVPRAVPGLIQAVAANQSLESSPIFDTVAEAEFTPSHAVASKHPDLYKLNTVASTPSQRRTLQGIEKLPAPLSSTNLSSNSNAPLKSTYSFEVPQQQQRIGPPVLGAVGGGGGGGGGASQLPPLNVGGGSPLDRPALGRTSSISSRAPPLGERTMGFSPLPSPLHANNATAATASAASAVAPVASGIPGPADSSPPLRPAKLTSLRPMFDKTRSTMARFETCAPDESDGSAAASAAPYPAPLSSTHASTINKGRGAIATELQALEAQNVRTS